MHPRSLLAPALPVAVVLAAAGAWALSGGDAAPRPAAAPMARRVVTPIATATPTPTATATARVAPAARAARPVRVQIPAIGVDVALIALGLDRTGALEVPTRFDVAGWWSGGARPGERGPAVIAGHVDSKTGPAVFFKLGQLRRGDAVVVRRGDGTSVRFTVQGSRRFSKDHFPSAQVYGPTGRPALRLITCSGTFDRASGHYLDNTVVFAAA
jgi:sortase (surface protein transpeptidase)